MECPLCHTSLHQVVCDDPKHFFYQCMHCDALVRSTTNYLSVEAEKQRYLLHNNNVLDELPRICVSYYPPNTSGF